MSFFFSSLFITVYGNHSNNPNNLIKRYLNQDKSAEQNDRPTLSPYWLKVIVVTFA